MYGFLFRPAWVVFHAIVLAAIVLMVNLGFWQLDRLAERQDFNRTVIERTEQAPVDVAVFLGPEAYVADRDEWTPVRLTGTYLPEQLVEFNQSQGGRAGENVLTALLLDEPGGATVIVNRGFIPLPSEPPEPPAVAVEVVGVIRASEERRRGGLTDPDQERLTEVRRIDVASIAPQLPGEVAPFYVQLVAADPAVGPGDPSPVARPELSDGPHLSYAVQWFVFSLCVAIGWVLAVRRSIRTRRRDDAGAAASDTVAGDTPAGDVNSAGSPEPADAGPR